MQKGFLVVETTAANGAIPVCAQVVILREGGDRLETVADASGRTALIELDAPDRAESLRPVSKALPYATVDVRVTAQPFRPVTVNGVQIFAGETSVVPVALEPARWETDEETVYNIPPNRMDRAGQTMDMPAPGSAKQLLDAVAVPQFITVHLGRPSESAHNMTVDFANYIKNVCSAEAYPTWPESALRAIMHCQISLALNRIYTGWYRSRGLDFDITNAPGYDPGFVPGRNIYANVSRLADEIFNIYIRQGDAVEPLFAHYCAGADGGPGLRVWEAVALAQAGLSPQNILRRFYGETCGLAQTEQVQCTARYPGITLTAGCTGEAVRALQARLQQIRQRYPAIPDLPADGVYDARTRQAVLAFQRLFNLKADGVAGRAVWYKTGRIAAAAWNCVKLKRDAAQFAAHPRPPEALRVGSRGKDVLLAQFLLGAAAAFYSGLAPVAMDGVFGRSTHAAVTDFQRMRGIQVDGVIGEETWDGLYEVYFACCDAARLSAFPDEPA